MSKNKSLSQKILGQPKSSDLTDFLEYLKNPWKIFWANFLAGLARGFGFILGATVVVSLFVYIVITLLVQLPIVGDTIQWASDSANISQIENLGNSLSKVTELLEKQNELLQNISTSK